MPVILPSEAWPAWLGGMPAERDDLLKLLKPYSADLMRAYPVSARVGNVKNQGPEFLELAE